MGTAKGTTVLADTADTVTTGLADWARSILPEVPALARPLGTHERTNGVDIRLIRVTPRPAARTSEPPVILDLDYLITVQMADAAAEQNALVELMFAAVERHESEVVTDQGIAELCTSLGIPVAAGFVLRTPLIRVPVRHAAKRVRVPLVVHTAELGVIEGRVVGPQDTPIAGAVISASGLNNTARSGHDGRFRLVGMPGTDAGVALTARARGAEADGVGVVGKPIVLRLALED
jgi:hypothetical protein